MFQKAPLEEFTDFLFDILSDQSTDALVGVNSADRLSIAADASRAIEKSLAALQDMSAPCGIENDATELILEPGAQELAAPSAEAENGPPAKPFDQYTEEDHESVPRVLIAFHEFPADTLGVGAGADMFPGGVGAFRRVHAAPEDPTTVIYERGTPPEWLGKTIEQVLRGAAE